MSSNVKPILGIGALVVGAVAAILLGISMEKPSENQLENTCRQSARIVFPEVISGTMTQAQGQAQIDKSCNGLTELVRSAIVNDERSAAIARAK
jgi:hypothetical protein